MGEIFCIDEHDLPWVDYDGGPGRDGIRVKALTKDADTWMRAAFIEYPAGYQDGIHKHEEHEVFVVSEGALALDGVTYGPGSIICIPGGKDYALHAGPSGARYFRIWPLG